MLFKAPARPLSARLRAQRQALESDAPGAVAASADILHGNVLKQWPSTEWGDIHPFATGTSSEAWELVQTGTDGLRYQLRNEVDYVQYTERGYTRKGPETARSWGIRAFGPYSATAIDQAAPEAKEQLTAAIDLMVYNNA